MQLYFQVYVWTWQLKTTIRSCFEISRSRESCFIIEEVTSLQLVYGAYCNLGDAKGDTIIEETKYWTFFGLKATIHTVQIFND